VGLRRATVRSRSDNCPRHRTSGRQMHSHWRPFAVAVGRSFAVERHRALPPLSVRDQITTLYKSVEQAEPGRRGTSGDFWLPNLGPPPIPSTIKKVPAAMARPDLGVWSLHAGKGQNTGARIIEWTFDADRALSSRKSKTQRFAPSARAAGSANRGLWRVGVGLPWLTTVG
jgi:hypothetical protein